MKKLYKIANILAYFSFLRPLCKSLVDAQGQTRGEEEDSGNEALSEPRFQRVLPL